MKHKYKFMRHVVDNIADITPVQRAVVLHQTKHWIDKVQNQIMESEEAVIRRMSSTLPSDHQVVVYIQNYLADNYKELILDGIAPDIGKI